MPTLADYRRISSSCNERVPLVRRLDTCETRGKADIEQAARPGTLTRGPLVRIRLAVIFVTCCVDACEKSVSVAKALPDSLGAAEVDIMNVQALKVHSQGTHREDGHSVPH